MESDDFFFFIQEQKIVIYLCRLLFFCVCNGGEILGYPSVPSRFECGVLVSRQIFVNATQKLRPRVIIMFYLKGEKNHKNVAIFL